MTAPGYQSLILASASAFRAMLMRNAGLEFDTVPANIDERAVEEPLQKAEMDAAGIAEILARAKADEVSARMQGGYVIGADQTLSLEEEILHKPADLEAARRRLLLLSGRTHQLHSAICLTRDRKCLWSQVETSHIRFRKLDPGFVGRHLAIVGETALASVGAYRFEGPGIQLVERYEGDFFSILGLPLLPLVAKLRELGVVDG